MFKKCTPLWHEAHFEVKTWKMPEARSALRSGAVESVHAVVAGSTFRNQNVQSTPRADIFWKLRCSKSARTAYIRARHIGKWQALKTDGLGPLFEAKRFRMAGKTWGFVAVGKTMAGVGRLKRICKDGFRMAGPCQRYLHQRCSEVRALISWGRLHFGTSNAQVHYADFALQVQHFVWLGFTSSRQAQYSRQMGWKKSLCYEAVSSAPNFPFFIKVSQNFFVFDVAQVKLSRTRRISSFWSSEFPFLEEVSQNCFVSFFMSDIER